MAFSKLTRVNAPSFQKCLWPLKATFIMRSTISLCLSLATDSAAQKEKASSDFSITPSILRFFWEIPKVLVGRICNKFSNKSSSLPLNMPETVTLKAHGKYRELVGFVTWQLKSDAKIGNLRYFIILKVQYMLFSFLGGEIILQF